jgi:hypothetical protein
VKSIVEMEMIMKMVIKMVIKCLTLGGKEEREKQKWAQGKGI